MPTKTDREPELSGKTRTVLESGCSIGYRGSGNACIGSGPFCPLDRPIQSCPSRVIIEKVVDAPTNRRK